MASDRAVLEIAGREVTISNPDEGLLPGPGLTKLDLVRYYLAVADGALRGVGGRPMALKRYVDGADGESFFQKRAPASRPGLDRDRRRSGSRPGARRDEIVVRDAAQLAWIVNLGCIDLNPHPVRADDLEHPDELRVDLDPVPGVEWAQIRDVALVVARRARGPRARRLAEDVGLARHPRLRAHRAALDVPGGARARRSRWRARWSGARPDLATSKWWKEERHGVFLDYNQNAKDRTVASAYSVRPTPDARVSMPLALGRGRGRATRRRSRWRRCPSASRRSATRGRGIDDGRRLARRAARARRARRGPGHGDAPWPPHYAKGEDEQYATTSTPAAAGADDYLAKPFALAELLARLRALLRRAANGDDAPDVLRFADLELHLGTREVRRGSLSIELTRTEFSLLELFLRNPRQVLTRSIIFERVWGYDFGPTSNSLDVYIGYLRRKTEDGGAPRLIHTVRGVGYALRES